MQTKQILAYFAGALMVGGSIFGAATAVAGQGQVDVQQVGVVAETSPVAVDAPAPAPDIPAPAPEAPAFAGEYEEEDYEDGDYQDGDDDENEVEHEEEDDDDAY